MKVKKIFSIIPEFKIPGNEKLYIVCVDIIRNINNLFSVEIDGNIVLVNLLNRLHNVFIDLGTLKVIKDVIAEEYYIEYVTHVLSIEEIIIRTLDIIDNALARLETLKNRVGMVKRELEDNFSDLGKIIGVKKDTILNIGKDGLPLLYKDLVEKNFIAKDKERIFILLFELIINAYRYTVPETIRRINIWKENINKIKSVYEEILKTRTGITDRDATIILSIQTFLMRHIKDITNILLGNSQLMAIMMDAVRKLFLYI